MAKCPICRQDAKYIGQSHKHTANGHHARVYKCTSNDCPKDDFVGGWD